MKATRWISFIEGGSGTAPAAVLIRQLGADVAELVNGA